MKRLLFVMTLAAGLAAADSAFATAETNTAAQANETRKPGKLTERQKELLRRARYRKTGGMLKRPGKQQGAIGFIVLKDERIPRAKVEELGKILERNSRLDIRLIEVGSVPSRGLAGEMARFGVKAAAFVTWREDCDLALLHAPEQNWAVVNARVLKDGARDDATYGDRILKESARAYALACGAAGAMGGEGLMNVRSLAELDQAQAEFSHDLLSRMNWYTRSLGVTPYEETTYVNACKEGWAPAPTNDIQKAIWDKVHTPPEKPLKISYDKAAQKPVVK